MPVFDFNDAPVSKEKCVCTYTTFQSNEPEATPEKPILVLDNHKKQWAHHSAGMFTNPIKRSTFECSTDLRQSSAGACSSWSSRSSCRSGSREKKK